jgi:hypothetical protein
MKMSEAQLSLTAEPQENHQTYLLSVVLVQLCLATVAAPQTQNPCLRRVCHVDQPFEPPTLNNRSVDAAQHKSIVAHFQEPQRTGRVDALVHGEALAVQ